MSDPQPPQSQQDDDLRALLAKRQHSRPTKATWVLLALIAVALGFAMGACSQRVLSTGTGAPEPAPSRVPTTIGTVTSVTADTLVLTTATGETVTVVVPEGIPVTTAVEVPLGELPVGARVEVQGSADSAGVVTAESIAEEYPRTAPAP